ncbi:MAG: hypothetical protein GY711_10195 [bacterium]|nr:hypothetical protein [bacterium]
MTRTARLPRLVSLAALYAVLALAGYWVTLGDVFLSDDYASLYKASRASGWLDAASPGEQFSERWIRPLPAWTWYLNYHWFGLEPIGYRLFNVALHVLNAVLLAGCVSTLARSRSVGAFAGAAFAVLPSHPDAVAWVCARYDLLCVTGVLVCIGAWSRYVDQAGRAWHLVAASAAAVAALASKEMALSLPLLLAVVTLGFHRPAPRRALLGLGVVTAIVAVYLAARFSLLGGMGGLVEGEQRSHTSLAPGRLEFLRSAVVLSFTPANRELFPLPWHPLKIFPIVVLAAGWLAFGNRDGRALLRTALPFLVLFAVALLPVAPWARIGIDNHNTRYLYLPTAFSCAALGALVRGAGALRARVLFSGAAVAIAVWLAGLVIESGSWHEGARRAERMVTALPAHLGDPGPREAFVTDLPGKHHGAPIFKNGFHLAVRMYTEYAGRVWVVDRAGWEERRATPGADAGAFLRWDGTDEDWQRD